MKYGLFLSGQLKKNPEAKRLFPEQQLMKKWGYPRRKRGGNKLSKFKLGQLLMTRGVNDLVAENEEFAKFAMQSVERHAAGDWGDLSEEDKKENELSIDKNLRLLSAHKKNDWKIWIITEADRSATTILFPDEY
ncbi:MAG: hypothetical protein ACE5K3_00900 [bacterium]